MKKLLLVVLCCGVAFAQDLRPVALLDTLKRSAEQTGVGLYDYSLETQEGSTRTYTSDFQTPEGELIPLVWTLRSQDKTRHLNSVKVSTVASLSSSRAGYAMGYSWTTVLDSCFDASERAQAEINRWVQEQLETVDNYPSERRFLKRVDTLDFLLELAPNGSQQTQASVTMSRKDSPETKPGNWKTACTY